MEQNMVVLTQKEVELKILQLEKAFCFFHKYSNFHGQNKNILQIEAEIANAHRYLKMLKIYDEIIEKYKENKVAKELTVAEISEALGYEVKVVKEQSKPEPYQFKAGDVIEFDYSSKEKRIMVEIKGVLYSLYLDGTIACYAAKNKDRIFAANHYKKIGELKDYIK